MHGHDRSIPRRRHAHLLALEPRMMFDAAAVMTAEAVVARSHAESAGAAHPVAEPAHETHALPPAHAIEAHPLVRDAAPATAAPHEIIFIDTTVPDYRQLTAQWASRGEVVLIDGRTDGIAAIEATLAREHDVAAIHIVSHGEEGAFFLGTTKVDQAAIDGALKADFARIGAALNAGGDILIYGCDFAEGRDGAAALHSLARASGRDVAASTDLTGAAARGGDWTLEAHDGAIQARTLDAAGWAHVLGPNVAVPIAVQPDSLTVTDASGAVVASGTSGYTGNYTPAITQAGATAVWTDAATAADGRHLDLKATVVALSAGDQIQFFRPGQGANPDDATFLITDNTSGASDATVSIQWQLVLTGTDTPAPANIEFTIGDIDGVDGSATLPSRESVATSTDHLAYYTHEATSDIHFDPSLSQVVASGTRNENTVTGQPESSASNATFDWTDVTAFTLDYRLTANNGVTNRAQFYQDGNATLAYSDPRYVSIPRLDLDGADATATGTGAHFVYTENGAATPIVDQSVVVTNPMPENGAILGADVVLTNAKAGDVLAVTGTLPSGITAQIDGSTPGQIRVTLSGAGDEATYRDALKAIGFSSTSDNPDTSQRDIAIDFSNDTLTSNVAHSLIDMVRVNDAPAATSPLADRTTQDGAVVSYDTASGFSDADGDALHYAATGLPAGLGIDRDTGVISGTVDRSASQAQGGHYTITVTATDPSGAAATQTFAVDVTNPPPVAADDSTTTREDSAVVVPVLANDSDPDGDPLSVVAASAGHGSVVRNADGTLTYTPDADYNGTDTISYTISDGQGGTSSARVAVTITPVNDAPTTAATLPPRATTDSATVNWTTAQGFADADGDALHYAATGMPAGLVIDRDTGIISGTLDRSASQAQGGHYTITVTATDPSGATATQSFAADVTNPAPVAADDSATTREDTAVVIAVLANDSDPDGDPLSVVAASAGHGSVVRNADGTLTYTPDANYNGTDTIAYTISDGQGGTSSARVAVTITPVNDAPATAATLPPRATTDSATVNWTTAQGFSDADGDTLHYAATGLPAGLDIDRDTGVISGTVDRSASQAQGGRYTITVTATDPSGATATQTFAADVTNPAPLAADDGATTHVDTPVTIAVLANDSDPDGDPIAVTAAAAGHGTVAIDAGGTITYTPATGFAGTDRIVYTITDSDGATAQAVATVTVTDTPPTAAPIADQRAADGQAISLAAGSAFSDADGNALGYRATGLPAGLVIDPDTGMISGTIDRSASQAGGGIYDTIVTADDRHGGTATTTIHWTIANPGPTARDDTAATDEDVAVTIAPLANDSDPDGDPLSIESAAAAHGRVAIGADGRLVYTPDADFNGIDTIRYTATDGEGGRSSATVTITVRAIDDAPVALAPPPPRSDVAGRTVSVPLAAGFADIDGDALTYSASGLPAGLTIDPATGTISGTLAAHDAIGGPAGDGRYPVSVTATDPSGRSATSGFVWTVTPAGPIARADTAGTRADTPVRIDVLANDSDPDGLPLTLIGASATHGTATIVDGAILFTPDPGYVGAARIGYVVGDGRGDTATADVAITVLPNRAPIAGDDVATTRQGVAVTIPVLANDGDPDGDTPLVVGASAGHGTVAIDPAGTLTYTPARGFAGSDAIDYTISDGHGGSATAHVAVTVIPDAAPVIGPRAPIDAIAGRPIAIDPLRTVSDPEHDPLTVTAASATAGAVTIDPDGTLTFVPARGFVGTTAIVFTVDDGHGGTATGTIPVRVTAEPAADIDQLLAIGRGVSPAWRDASERDEARGAPPVLRLADPILVPGGVGRSPFPLRAALDAIRSLGGTGDLATATPVGDAAEGARSLDGIGESEANGAGYAVTVEVARLQRLADFRDAAERLFAHRWQDIAGGNGGLGGFGVHGATGFATAGAHGGVMIETLVQGGAIYVDVRDTAADRVAPIRSIDVTATGGARPAWLTVDRRGFAIVEADALTDEVRLVVTVVRSDGSRTTTPVVIQRATGEIEVDRHAPATRIRAARPLDATLSTPHAAHRDAAAKLNRIFG